MNESLFPPYENEERSHNFTQAVRALIMPKLKEAGFEGRIDANSEVLADYRQYIDPEETDDIEDYDDFIRS